MICDIARTWIYFEASGHEAFRHEVLRFWNKAGNGRIEEK